MIFNADNIVLIVDRNEFQANVRTEDLVPLEPIEAKFAAFGWGTIRINGHDFDDMERSFARLPLERGKPSVVVADTVHPLYVWENPYYPMYYIAVGDVRQRGNTDGATSRLELSRQSREDIGQFLRIVEADSRLSDELRMSTAATERRR